MEEVTFSEEDATTARSVSTPPSLGISGLLIKLGIARSAKEAQMILLGVVVVCVLSMAGLWITSATKQPAPYPYVEGQNVLLPPRSGAR